MAREEVVADEPGPVLIFCPHSVEGHAGDPCPRCGSGPCHVLVEKAEAMADEPTLVRILYRGWYEKPYIFQIKYPDFSHWSDARYLSTEAEALNCMHQYITGERLVAEGRTDPLKR